MFVSVALFCGCDSLSMKEYVESTPIIGSFTPESGSIGSEVVVTGTYLDDVVGASIGGGEVTVVQKVSNERLSLKVTSLARSGRITLTNAIGEGVSDADFTIEYPFPSVSQSLLPSVVEMGNKLLISGEHMNVVDAVLFTAVGSTSNSEAEIISQSDKEIVVKVPYVESDDAVLTFKYFDGTSEVETPQSTGAQLTVKRYQPVVATTSFEPVGVGDVIVLEGEYLDKIDKVLLGDLECTITMQTASELRFVVPNSDSYVNGDNSLSLSISYFDGRETPVLTDNFIVRLAYVYYWTGKTIYAQAGEPEAFFSPETGQVYSTDVWATSVDPVSAAGKNKLSTVNVPVASADDYNSVNPYFFISGGSDGSLAIQSPANSNGQLSNFKTSDGSKMTGGTKLYGTPSLSFALIDPSSSDAAAQLVADVKAGNLKHIDEETFPIDVDAKTCAGIKPSVSAAPKNVIWANGIFTVGTEKTGAEIDAVLFVFYYDVNGYDNKATDKNPVKNVKRIGLLHVKTADYKISSGNNPGKSSITFNMYWQKQDYDYSKIQ